MNNGFQNHIYVPEDPPAKPGLLPIIILLFMWPLGTAVAAYLGFKRLKREWKRKKYHDYRRYANAIGSRASVDVQELAAKLGRTPQDVVSDLQAMIDEGIIGGSAYIDHTRMTLFLDASVLPNQVRNGATNVNVYVNGFSQSREAQASRPEASTQQGAQVNRRPFINVVYDPQAASAPKQEAQPAAKPADNKTDVGSSRRQPQPQKNGFDNADFEEKLREIRKLNDEIADKDVSDRIDRIGELTASIFRVVREKPERADEVRKFMNYYLPTTFKLLKSYSLMEKQSYQGENIKASRKQIEDVLDKLVLAFEKQQDRLFQNDMLDVETDISVLETMMTSDGLLEPRAAMRRRPVPAKPQAQAEEKPQEGATATMGGEG